MGPEGAPRATAHAEFPPHMNDDITRRGCSLKTHCNSFILHSGFSCVHLALKSEARSHDCERWTHGPRGRPARHGSPRVSSPYERRRQSSRVLSRNPLALWGSQSWLQPAFSRLTSPTRPLVSAARDVPEGPSVPRVNALRR